eukprot:scaffold7552_cov25-Tisochrysis_lutea.AAC.1
MGNSSEFWHLSGPCGTGALYPVVLLFFGALEFCGTMDFCGTSNFRDTWGGPTTLNYMFLQTERYNPAAGNSCGCAREQVANKEGGGMQGQQHLAPHSASACGVSTPLFAGQTV